MPDPKSLFKQMDKDEDGKLSPEEFARGLRAIHPPDRPMTRPMIGRPPFRPSTPRPGIFLERLRAADRNRDGKISRDEAPEPMKARFDRIDVNNDGQLTMEEIRRLVAMAMRRPMGRHPQAALPPARRPAAGRPPAGRPQVGRPPARRLGAVRPPVGRPQAARPPVRGPEVGRPPARRPAPPVTAERTQADWERRLAEAKKRAERARRAAEVRRKEAEAKRAAVKKRAEARKPPHAGQRPEGGVRSPEVKKREATAKDKKKDAEQKPEPKRGA